MTIVVVTAIVYMTLLFCSTISTVRLWPYSLRLDFLYLMVQNNRVFLIHPLSDPFKVFLSYLKYSRVTTSHQGLTRSFAIHQMGEWGRLKIYRQTYESGE